MTRGLARMCGLNRAFSRYDPARHGMQKVVPDTETIEARGRRLIEQRLASKALAEIRDRITRQAAATALPADSEDQLRSYLAHHPSLSWDDALAQIIGGQHGRDVMG